MFVAGAEPIRIKEKQRYEWLEGETLKIVSIPIVQVRKTDNQPNDTESTYMHVCNSRRIGGQAGAVAFLFVIPLSQLGAVRCTFS
jgi:hypothetical protein